MKNTLNHVELEDKSVIVRVDFNVPIENGTITSNARIVASLPTIEEIFRKKPKKVILLSHLGRIKTKDDLEKKSLRPIAKELAYLTRRKVVFCASTRGKEVEDKLDKLNPGEILLLENTRFEDLNNKAESSNKAELGKYWASLANVFVNDAFGTVHRAHASNVGIAKNIQESCIGFLVERELQMLGKAVYDSKRPLIAIIGGSKVSDKIKVINNLINKVDYLLIGGGMAYTFLKAQNLNVGSSLVEEDKVPLAKEYLKKYSDKIVLPIDSALSKTFTDSFPKYNIENSLEIPEGWMGLDIGPKTIHLFRKVLNGAKTVIWNGPMGVAEFSHYKLGTEEVANIIANQKKCFSIIGGGDSAAAIYNLGLEKNFSHISTGGGASLTFLEGAALPGVDAIQEIMSPQEKAAMEEAARLRRIKVDKEGMVVVKHPKLVETKKDENDENKEIKTEQKSEIKIQQDVTKKQLKDNLIKTSKEVTEKKIKTNHTNSNNKKNNNNSLIKKDILEINKKLKK